MLKNCLLVKHQRLLVCSTNVKIQNSFPVTRVQKQKGIVTKAFHKTLLTSGWEEAGLSFRENEMTGNDS